MPTILRRRLSRLFAVALLGLAVAGPAGCGGSNRAAVRGKVTLDGQPLEMGRINFFPDGENKGPAAGAVILNGSYSVPARNGVVVGKNRVEIHGTRKTGKKIISAMSGQPIDEVGNPVPAKYNTKSELIRDVKPGSEEIDFDLKSQ
jgi:hypothetical protein